MAHLEVEISAEQLKMLKQLVERFPWFSFGQLLLLKGMKQQRQPSFSAQLLLASLYATSRERLYDYLKQIKIAAPQAPDTPAADASLTDDGFEVMPFDTVCEEVVEAQPEAQPLPPRQPSSAARHEQLIDIFLATQPSAITIRPDTSSSDLAQPAGKNTAHELVSETLAEIYLAQGLVDKAEQTYSKLSLLYPEKRAYFAARFAADTHPQSATALR
ncbi:MAG: hypothetical protein LBF67_05680 [Prevotellaceae bacterium]|nr:hypothetical protein [Prevotellaceae bacterium]